MQATIGAWGGRPVGVATVYDPSDGGGDAGRLGLPPWPEALQLLAELSLGASEIRASFWGTLRRAGTR